MLKADIMNEMSPLMEKAINSNSKKTMEEIKEMFGLFSKINSETMKEIKEMLELFSKINSGNK
jgi:hypothetical protein